MHHPVTLRSRVVSRGGKWGVRAFRLAMALQDKEGTGRMTAPQIAHALEVYGVAVGGVDEVTDTESGLMEIPLVASLRDAQGGKESETDKPHPPATVVRARLRCMQQQQMGVTSSTGLDGTAPVSMSIGALMQKIVGPVRRETLQLIGIAYQKVRAAYGASMQPLPFQRRNGAGLVDETALPTVSFVCAAVHIERHPDVESSKVSLKDALFCYFSLWGLSMEATISHAVFQEFHADFLVGCSTTAEASNVLCRLYDVDPEGQKHVGGASTLAPRREDSDRLFQEIDMNGNGMLSLAELDLAVMRMWPALNYKPAIMRAYKLADRNGNGTLSRSEFFAFLHYLVAYGKIMDMFRTIDSDRDGRLSFDELREHKSSLGLTGVGDVELREIFRAMDANHGGKVLFEEFAVFIAKRNGDAELSKTTSGA